MTQGQLAEKLHVDQGTVSRWERGVESPRPARRALLQSLLLRDQGRRAMLRSTAFVRQDYRPSTLLDSKLRLVEISKSANRHFRVRGQDPDSLIGMSLERYSDRAGVPGFHMHLHGSGLLKGACLLFRFVRNYGGRGHATVYEPIFEDEKLVGVLNYVTHYFDLTANTDEAIELIEIVRTDDPDKAIALHRGPNAEEAERAVRRPHF